MRPGLRPRAADDAALAAPTDSAGPSHVQQPGRVASAAAPQAGDFQNGSAAGGGSKRRITPSSRLLLLQDTQAKLNQLSRKPAAGGLQKKRPNPAATGDHDPMVQPRKKQQVGKRAAYHATDYKLGELEELLSKTASLHLPQIRELLIRGAAVDGGGGSGGGVAPDRGCGMTQEELESLADLTLDGKRAGTISAYKAQVNKLEWFLKYGHNDKICQEWAKYDLRAPLPEQHLDFCCPDGPAMAQRALRWAGKNFPGYYEAMNTINTKPTVVSFSSFDGFAAAMNTVYKLQAITSGKADSLNSRIREYALVNEAYNGVKTSLAVKGGM